MKAQDGRDGTISLRQNHRLLPTRSAAPAAIAKADGVRVLLFDGDPIHREALTDELSKQGFVIRSSAIAAHCSGRCAALSMSTSLSSC
jgi:hypothetical protein